MKTAIKCGQLLDTDSGNIQKDAVIIVDGKTITEVQNTVPEGVEIIDLSDKFVMPGLIDAHVHTVFEAKTNHLEDDVLLTAGAHALMSLKNAQRHLAAGFTTIRDCGSRSFVDVALRNAINSGAYEGPNMKVCGDAIGSTGGHADSHFSPDIQTESHSVADGPDGFRAAARYNLKHGADFLKFMSTGGVMSRGTTVGSQQMTFDEIRAVVEVAEMYGVHTATHAHGTAGIKAAVRAGVTSVEHGMMLDDEAIELMLKHGTYLSPTIIAAERIITNGTEAGLADWVVKKAKQVFENHEKGFRKCLMRGVKIVFGSDAGTPFNHHGKQGLEFELMCSFGMTPLQTLKAATVTNAALLGMSDSVGQIKSGMFADIVAFDKNPLDDITVMKNCTFVMSRGKVFTTAL